MSVCTAKCRALVLQMLFNVGGRLSNSSVFMMDSIVQSFESEEQDVLVVALFNLLNLRSKMYS